MVYFGSPNWPFFDRSSVWHISIISYQLRVELSTSEPDSSRSVEVVSIRDLERVPMQNLWLIVLQAEFKRKVRFISVVVNSMVELSIVALHISHRMSY